MATRGGFAMTRLSLEGLPLALLIAIAAGAIANVTNRGILTVTDTAAI